MENLRNQDNIGEKELLCVSFGTSFEDTRKRTIGAIEDDMEKAFPDMSVRRAFTSGMIIKHVKERDGIIIDSIKESLERAKANGVKELYVQPTHLMDGKEYDKLINGLKEHEAAFENLYIGKPLLMDESDFTAVAKAVRDFLSEYGDDTSAYALMGHGTDAISNKVYDRIQKEFKEIGCDNFYIGTVEAKPDIEDILEEIKKHDYKKIVMMPLMVVAGDHANNDMAGDEEDSWKTIFNNAGYETVCVLKGIGEIPAVRQIYCDHAKNAVKL